RLKLGHMIRVPDRPSVADGIAGNIDLDTMTFPLIQKYVDDGVLVSESEIESAMNHLIEREKLVAEGAEHARVGADLFGKIDVNGSAAVVLTGGNVDSSFYLNTEHS